MNGEAVLSRDPALTVRFSVQGKLPNTVIAVKVTEAHCAAHWFGPTCGTPPGTLGHARFQLLAQCWRRTPAVWVKAQQVDEEAVTRVPATLY